MGEHKLKNVADPIRVYVVAVEHPAQRPLFRRLNLYLFLTNRLSQSFPFRT